MTKSHHCFGLVVHRMRNRALNCRIYSLEDRHQHYLTQPRPLFLKTAQTSLGERPWSKDERKTLRNYFSYHSNWRLIWWPGDTENVIEDALVAWAPVSIMYGNSIWSILDLALPIQRRLNAYLGLLRVSGSHLHPLFQKGHLLALSSIQKQLSLPAHWLALTSIGRTSIHLQCSPIYRTPR